MIYANDLQRWEKLAREAAPGPCKVYPRSNDPTGTGYPVRSTARHTDTGCENGYCTTMGFSSLSDALFHAEAREIVLALIERVRALEQLKSGVVVTEEDGEAD